MRGMRLRSDMHVRFLSNAAAVIRMFGVVQTVVVTSHVAAWTNGMVVFETREGGGGCL